MQILLLMVFGVLLLYGFLGFCEVESMSRRPETAEERARLHRQDSAWTAMNPWRQGVALVADAHVRAFLFVLGVTGAASVALLRTLLHDLDLALTCGVAVSFFVAGFYIHRVSEHRKAVTRAADLSTALHDSEMALATERAARIEAEMRPAREKADAERRAARTKAEEERRRSDEEWEKARREGRVTRLDG